MTISPTNGREMLTAEQVRELTGVPISTLHDWAAKRERGIVPAFRRLVVESSGLADPFPISLQAVSKHLKVLERAGLITRGRAAQWRNRKSSEAPASRNDAIQDGIR